MFYYPIIFNKIPNYFVFILDTVTRHTDWHSHSEIVNKCRGSARSDTGPTAVPVGQLGDHPTYIVINDKICEYSFDHKKIIGICLQILITTDCLCRLCWQHALSHSQGQPSRWKLCYCLRWCVLLTIFRVTQCSEWLGVNLTTLGLNHSIESLLQEIVERKIFALTNLSWNFTEVIINANKGITENWLLSVNFAEIYIYKPIEQPITAIQSPDCDWLFHWLIKVNFSKLTV